MSRPDNLLSSHSQLLSVSLRCQKKHNAIVGEIRFVAPLISSNDVRHKDILMMPNNDDVLLSRATEGI